MSAVDLSDHFYLCGNCGGVAHWESFRAFLRDDETGEYYELNPGVKCTDPMLKCPKCGWEHVDDDSNPGLWGGTRLSVQRERASLLAEPDGPWADNWADPGVSQ